MEYHPRLANALDRGRFFGTIKEGVLKDLMIEAGYPAAYNEGFVVAILNRDDVHITTKLISVGGATTVMVSIRDVFREAVSYEKWSKIIVSHNHPDGDPTPSEEDKALTKSFKQGGQLLGIDVVDHIIIGDGYFYSFTDDEIYPTYTNISPLFKKKEQEPVQPVTLTQQKPVRPPKPLEGEWYWSEYDWQWFRRPRKPDPVSGFNWVWSEPAIVWCQEPDMSTLVGKFFNLLRTK